MKAQQALRFDSDASALRADRKKQQSLVADVTWYRVDAGVDARYARLTMDWTGCPLVTSRPAFISGAPALRDDPRMPADLVVENMDLGESGQDVVANYQLHTSPEDVVAVYQFAKQRRVYSPAG